MPDVQPPKSPTLLPPRKSVELEDSGAHDLESSNDDEEVFSDAHDVVQSASPPNSPIPTTRVEKVDDVPSHVQVPGTAAYQSRAQYAVPDELEIIPEGLDSRQSFSQGKASGAKRPAGIQIPKTVVEKVDLASPSHGDVPGTASYEKRMADAVPDVILQVPELGQTSIDGPIENIQANVPIPTTVITKVDSEPSHGEVPDTEAYKIRTMDAKPDIVEKEGDAPGWPTSSLNRSSHFDYLGRRSSVEGTSPIAADGGFGPMNYNEDDSNDDNHEDGKQNDVGTRMEVDDTNDASADDFDDFEEGATADDFGDFDDGFQQPKESEMEPEESPMPFTQPFLSSKSHFPLLDFSNLSTLDAILTAASPHLSTLFPSNTNISLRPTDPLPSPPPLLSSRSLSLWTQLIAPPPLQPPNWVRSRIRRLFLVSLGVPVDLDEILPASKQKKLVLPFTPSDSLAVDQGQARKGNIVRLKQPPSESALPSNSSTTSLSSTAVPKPTAPSSSRKRRGPLPPPPLSLPALHILTSTTPLALQNMSDSELKSHVKELEETTSTASLVLEYWLQRREESKAGREAFEGVIANLVKFARGRRGKGK